VTGELLGLAILIGGLIGVALRLSVHRLPTAIGEPAWQRALATGLAGALALGVLTGAAMSYSDPGISISAPSAAASAALLTYCGFNGAVIAGITRRSGVPISAGIIEILLCLAAGTTGVVIGIWSANALW
jgi:hypothetical protein